MDQIIIMSLDNERRIGRERESVTAKVGIE